jgi:hypothetical protein
VASRLTPETRSRRKYRTIALECFQLARVVKEPGDRRQLLELASKWLERAGDDVELLKLIAEVEALKGPAN